MDGSKYAEAMIRKNVKQKDYGRIEQTQDYDAMIRVIIVNDTFFEPSLSGFRSFMFDHLEYVEPVDGDEDKVRGRFDIPYKHMARIAIRSLEKNSDELKDEVKKLNPHLPDPDDDNEEE